MLTTVQDLPGRTGLWEVGVPPSGPMDARSFAHANALVGNDPGAPGLEATLQGPAFRIPAGGVIAISGADGPITVDGQRAPHDQAITVPPGALVDIGWATRGARSTSRSAAASTCPRTSARTPRSSPAGSAGSRADRSCRATA